MAGSDERESDPAELRRRLEELEASQQRYRAVFDFANDAIFSHDTRTGAILEVNRRAEEIFGLPRETILRTDVQHLSAGEAPYTQSEAMRRIAKAAAGQPQVFEWRARRGDGTLFWAEVSVRATGAQPTDRVVAVVRDIEQRKRTEEALREGEAKFRGLIESSSDWIWEVNAEGVYTYSSPQVEAILGYTPPEVVGKTPFDLMPPDEAARVEDFFRAVAARGEPIVAMESLNLHKDGRRVVLESSGVPVRDAAGTLVGYRGMDRDVTERKRAETALRESENRMRSLFAAAPVGIGLVADRKLLDVNERFCEITGYAPEDVIGHSARILYPSQEDFEYVGREKYRQISERGTGTVETQFFRKDGRIIDVLLSSTPLDPDDLSAGVTFTALDITERKAAETALRESENRFRTVSELTSDYTYAYRIEPDGRFVAQWVTGAFQRVTGYVPAELTALGGWEHLVHPDDLGVARGQLDALLANRPETVEYRIVTKGGEVRWMRDYARPTWNEAEQRVTGIEGAMQDITERTRAAEALRESEARLRILFEQAADPIYVCDMSGQLVQVNDSACRSTGYTEEQLLGMAITDVDADVPSPEVPRESLGGLSADRPATIESVHRRKDGSTFPVEITLSFLETPGGRQVLGIARDLTRRKEAEAEKARLEAQYRQAQKLEAVGRLAGGVAHDFNNKLQAILGFAYLALSEDSVPDEIVESLKQIQVAAEQSADLTHQLLAFARKQTVSPKRLDLNETVAGMLRMLRRLMGEDIDLAWRPAADLWPVRIDPTQVDQVLANLCVNARDAVQGVGKVTIETTNVRIAGKDGAARPGVGPGEYVCLIVTDSGCGMDADTLAHAFEPFFTTKGSGEGTGLGLSTVYGIVKQNGGFVNARSEPGRGTAFRIHLPRHAGKAELRQAPEPPGPVQRGHETVLFVEDEPAILKLGRRMLETLGYSALAAATPGEALDLARNHPGQIDLLLTDVVMPEMNGRDLAKRLLSLYPDLKRLFMSGYTADVIAHHGVLEEGVHFLQKPFSREELATKVREALGLR